MELWALFSCYTGTHWGVCKTSEFIPKKGLLAWKVLEFKMEPSDVSDQILSEIKELQIKEKHRTHLYTW